jgi:RPA family protein
MDFELTMRLFLGDKAYHIAGQENHDKYRREWLLKAAKKILRRVDAIETTTRHKQVLKGTMGTSYIAPVKKKVESDKL